MSAVSGGREQMERDLATFDRARAEEAQGRWGSASAGYGALSERFPFWPEPLLGRARIAMRTGDLSNAVQWLAAGWQRMPGEEQVVLDLAVALATADDLAGAIQHLQGAVDRVPDWPTSWLLLGRLLQAEGQDLRGLVAAFEAVTRAVRRAQWLSPDATPVGLADAVEEATTQVFRRRAELLWQCVEAFEADQGARSLVRVRQALASYLGEAPQVPQDPRQRPTFLYVPGLPAGPFHDPMAVPWASRLLSAYPEIRREALEVLDQGVDLVDFVQEMPSGRSMRDYVGGESKSAAWEAFFFYKRGRRFDDHHARCPVTSAVLDGSPLCSIQGQAPEILFSVLRAGSHIQPHYGVTNARSVLHLPLQVPKGCALNLVDRGLHEWREGELVLFDDTFLHEAWNRSAHDRVVLLMDCWNPHLSAPEQQSLKALIERISLLAETRRLLATAEASGPLHTVQQCKP